jgi:transposase
MRAGIVVSVMPQDRILLETIVAHCNTQQKHAARARVIVATADGRGTAEVMRCSGLSKPVVWRWQERFMLEGVDGLQRDKTPKPGKQPLPAATVQRLLDLPLTDPPGETTHWSVRAMAKAAGIGAVSEQRIWQANGLGGPAKNSTRFRKWLSGVQSSNVLLFHSLPPAGLPAHREGWDPVPTAAPVRPSATLSVAVHAAKMRVCGRCFRPDLDGA